MLKRCSLKNFQLFSRRDKNSQIRFFCGANVQRKTFSAQNETLTNNEVVFFNEKAKSTSLSIDKSSHKKTLAVHIFNRLFLKESIEDGRLIKAVFSKFGEEDKKLFSDSNCLITLSIGQQVHTGVYLAATLEIVNHSFKSCTFVLGDTLQRLTLALTEPDTEQKLYLVAKQQGEQWLKDNAALLSRLTIPWKITRWDYWLENKKFKKILSIIENEYNLESKFKETFDCNVQIYIERLKNRGVLKIDEEQAKKLCLRYLQEECAVMWLWIEEGCQYELYANGRSPAMQATYERFIEPMHPDLLRPISMRFKKVANFGSSIAEKEYFETNANTQKKY